MEASVCTRTRDQTPQTPSSRLDFSPAQAPRAGTVGDTDALLNPDRDTPRRSRHKPAEDGEASPRTSRPAPRRALILGPGALAGSRIPAPPRGRTGPTASTPLPAQPSAGSPEHVLGAPDLHRRGRRPRGSGSALCGMLRRVVGAGARCPASSVTCSGLRRLKIGRWEASEWYPAPRRRRRDERECAATNGRSGGSLKLSQVLPLSCPVLSCPTTRERRGQTKIANSK